MPERDARAFDPQQDRDLLARHEAGAKLDELAKSEGRSKSSVHRAVTRARDERDFAERSETARRREAKLAAKRKAPKAERRLLAEARPELLPRALQPPDVEPDPEPQTGRLIRRGSTERPSGQPRELSSLEYYLQWLDERDVAAGRPLPASSIARRERQQDGRTPVVRCIPWGNRVGPS